MSLGWIPVAAALLALALARGASAKLRAEEIEIKVALAARASEMVETLERWVEINTGSFNLEGLERMAVILAEALSGLGFTVEWEAGPVLEVPGREGRRGGPLIVARRQGAGSSAPHFLLVGHYDTVFEPDSGFQGVRRASDDPDRMIGPGVSDMKGGLVVMVFALRALAETGDLDAARWTVLLDADEELGSLGSRERIEAEARQASQGFVFESARPNGAMVRSRRGLGQFHLRVEGTAAHAGNAHARGRSAIRELAEKVLRIEALTDYERGVTLNVGTFHGGTKRNIVPARAEAWIDLRYDDLETGEEIRDKLSDLAREVFVEGTRTRLWGMLHRPPKVETEETRRLLGLHQEVVGDLGLGAPASVHAGGGTDGSLMSAVGLATLDSMGVRGGHAHTDREFALASSLWERAAIAAILFRRLALGE